MLKKVEGYDQLHVQRCMIVGPCGSAVSAGGLKTVDTTIVRNAFHFLLCPCGVCTAKCHWLQLKSIPKME